LSTPELELLLDEEEEGELLGDVLDRLEGLVEELPLGGVPLPMLDPEPPPPPELPPLPPP
jgi:hypothetical protein